MRIQSLEVELAESRGRVADMEQSWEQWLSLISHDLRGPLTLILGYVQTVLQHLPDEKAHDQDRHDLDAAINAALRLDKMISEIVDAARIEAHLLTLTPTEIELPPIVRHQVQKAQRRYPGRRIRVSIPDELPVLFADGRRVGQIIATFLSNAILFSSQTSPVTVSVTRSADHVGVAVADDGLGLTEAEKQHLFEKFYRHERAREVRREGLGLSLLVAKHLAMRLHGQLWVESHGPDRGSTFYLSLPIARVSS